MNPACQKTIRQRINCTGIGLHSGETVRLCLRPAQSGTGIRFIRTDITSKTARIDASYEQVCATTLGTTIANDEGVSIATIEHLMAAFSALGVDNVIVEVDGPEIPIMDGSAAPFVFLLECAGIVNLSKIRREIEILAPIRLEQDDKWVELLPCHSFCVSFAINFSSTMIGEQKRTVQINRRNFKTELSRARTFGFLSEIDDLRSHNLALGGSLDNAIVVDGDRILNEEGLRYKDEFVRHKILDAVGDLYLTGAPIRGFYRAYKAGHALNNKLLRELFAKSYLWRWNTCDTQDKRAKKPLSFLSPTTAQPVGELGLAV